MPTSGSHFTRVPTPRQEAMPRSPSPPNLPLNYKSHNAPLSLSSYPPVELQVPQCPSLLLTAGGKLSSLDTFVFVLNDSSSAIVRCFPCG